MSDASQSLVVKIKVNADGMIEGLSTAGKTADGFSQSVKQSFKAAGEGAKSASVEHAGFVGALRDFKQEATQASRTANFYAKSLTEIIPGAAGAQGAVKTMIAALLEGGGIGAGIELAVLALSKLKEYLAEDAAQAAELRKVHEEAMNAVEDGVRNASRAYEGWTTATQKVQQQLEDGVNQKVRALRQEAAALRADTKDSIFGDFFGTDAAKIDTINAKIHVLQSSLTSSKSQRLLGNLVSEEDVSEANRVAAEVTNIVASQGSEIFRIRTDLATKRAEIDHRILVAQHADDLSLVASYEQEKTALAQDAAQKTLKLRLQQELDFQTQTLAITKDTLSAESVVYAEGSLKIQALRNQLKVGGLDPNVRANIEQEITLEKQAMNSRAALAALETQNKWSAEVIAAQKGVDDINTIRLASELKIEALEQSLADESSGLKYAKQATAARAQQMQENAINEQARMSGLRTWQEYQDNRVAIAKRASDGLTKAMLDENKQVVNGFVKPLESAFSGMLKGMLDGTKSFADSMKALFQNIAGSIIDGLVKIGAEQITEAIAGAMATKAAAASAAAANTAVAATGAASAVAAIPIAGPGLAVAAAAETVGTLGAISAPLLAVPAYAAGGDFGPGPMLVGERGPEIITSRGSGTVIPNHALGGETHLHFHGIVDGSGLRQLVAKPEFVNALNEARRNGRIP